VPSVPFEDKTVHKMTYVPWPVTKKETYPWASRGRFEKPAVPFETNTSYNNR